MTETDNHNDFDVHDDHPFSGGYGTMTYTQRTVSPNQRQRHAYLRTAVYLTIHAFIIAGTVLLIIVPSAVMMFSTTSQAENEGKCTRV